MLRSTSSAGLARAPKVMPVDSNAYKLEEEIGQGVSAKARGGRPRRPGLQGPLL